MHVVPALLEFLQRHPAVEIELLLLDRVVDLVQEGIDVGVRIARLPDSSMIAIPVGEVRRVVVASPEFLESSPPPEHPSELANHPCVGHHGLAPGGRWTFQEGTRELAVRVQCGFATSLASAAVDACVAGLGFGLFLSYQVEARVREGSLRVVLEDFEPASIPVQIVYPDARLMTPRLRVFIDWLRDDLRRRPEIHRAPGASAS
jgi:DNA-binding transcriptional LysR family regulator